MLTAVSYLHSNKIIHRDIKPENILLDYKKGFECKLIDFAAAIEFDENEKQNEIKGTSYYIAPEIISGSYDEKCDIWSLGVIAYMLLTGNAPFDGRTDKEIIKSVRKGKYDESIFKEFNISSLAASFINGMLTYDPKRRLSAKTALQHEWIRH